LARCTLRRERDEHRILGRIRGYNRSVFGWNRIWNRISFFDGVKMDKKQLIKDIETMILHRNEERKNNNIFRISADDLNECFIEELYALLEKVKR